MPEALTLTLPVLTGILVMSAVTVGLKFAGFFTQRLIKPTPAATRFLNALPGGVILSLVAPMVASSGLSGLVSVGAAITAMVATGGMIRALAIGLACGLAVRHLIEG